MGAGDHLGHCMLIGTLVGLVGSLGVVASVASGATQSLERMRSEAEQRKTERSDASNTRGSRIMGNIAVHCDWRAECGDQYILLRIDM